MKIIADTHTHSSAGGHAYSTIEEMAEAAYKKNLKYLSITDHGPLMQGEPPASYFDELTLKPRIINSVKILYGIEANIIDLDGNLDLEREILHKLDWVIASFHEGVFYPKNTDEFTKAWLAVADNPYVDVIGHSGRSERYDYDTVLPVFREKDKLVEINGNSLYFGKEIASRCREIAIKCKEYKVPVIVNSDTHTDENVGNVEKAIEMLKSIDFPADLIVNGDIGIFESYLLKRNNKRKLL